MSPALGQVALLIYALALGTGGFVGYYKAGSRPSLIAGTVTGMVAVVSLLLTFSYNPNYGFLLGALCSAYMSIFFGLKFARTRKMMPSGMMSLLSIIVLGLMAAILWQDSGGNTP